LNTNNVEYKMANHQSVQVKYDLSIQWT